MKKEYVFEFSGTKEDFLDVLNPFQHTTSLSDDEFYYFDDFIVKIVGEDIHFGVARGGHSSGYWFIPEIIENDGKTVFKGTIQYIGTNIVSNGKRSKWDDIVESILFVLLLPIFLIIKLYMFFDWAIRKIIRKPKSKEKTTEERLYDLMENHLGCFEKVL